jgi:hypothetical protein
MFANFFAENNFKIMTSVLGLVNYLDSVHFVTMNIWSFPMQRECIFSIEIFMLEDAC